MSSDNSLRNVIPFDPRLEHGEPMEGEGNDQSHDNGRQGYKVDEDLNRRWAEDEPEGDASEPLVEGILGRGKLALIIGEPGVGKTFMALHLVDCLLRGNPFFGCQTTKSPVIYAALEDGGQEFQWRVWAIIKDRAGKQINRRLRVAYDEVIALNKGDVDARRIIATMQDDAKEIGEPFGLVVVDTLNMVMPDADENASGPMSRLIANMKLISHETGAAVLALHHPSQSNPERPRGHGSLLGAVSTVISVTREGAESGVLKVAVSKNRNGPRMAFRAKLRAVQVGRHEKTGSPI